MNRFFFEKENLIHGNIHLEGEDVQHLSKVLRLTVGDKILLCDGEGTEYLAELNVVEKAFAKATVLEKKPSFAEPEMEITLFQGIPKGDKMELIIQKSVEMGISHIVPVQMHRSVVKIENEKDGKKKQERWQRIAMEAAKQSGRGRIPQVHEPIRFVDAIKSADAFDYRILPYEKESSVSIKRSMKAFGEKNGKPKKAVILVGPEGGFEEKEVKTASEHGFESVTLGKRILRTETAGFVALACMMYEFDEME